MVDGKGRPSSLDGRLQGAVIEASLEFGRSFFGGEGGESSGEGRAGGGGGGGAGGGGKASKKGRLCFRVNNGPLLPSVVCFDREFVLRPWCFVVDANDRVVVVDGGEVGGTT